MSSLIRRRLFPCLLFGLFAASMSIASHEASSQETSWDLSENITEAAVAIAEIQKNKGANGAFAAIEVCYARSVEPAQNYSQEVERCLTQDILHSRMTATFYASLSQDARQRNKLPEPEAVTSDMSNRVNQAFSRLQVPVATAREIVAIINSVGQSAFMKARFPSQ